MLIATCGARVSAAVCSSPPRPDPLYLHDGAGDVDINFDPLVLLSNAVAAFALNLAVYLLIGKTSALTMNIAGESHVIRFYHHQHFI